MSCVEWVYVIVGMSVCVCMYMCLFFGYFVFECKYMLQQYGSIPLLTLSLFTPLSKTINRRCVEAVVQTSAVLSAQLNLMSYFDLKHYFYPDLPVCWEWEEREGEEEGR